MYVCEKERERSITLRTTCANDRRKRERERQRVKVVVILMHETLAVLPTEQGLSMPEKNNEREKWRKTKKKNKMGMGKPSEASTRFSSLLGVHEH